MRAAKYSLSLPRARASRDMTVPIGILRVSPTHYTTNFPDGAESESPGTLLVTPPSRSLLVPNLLRVQGALPDGRLVAAGMNFLVKRRGKICCPILFKQGIGSVSDNGE